MKIVLWVVAKRLSCIEYARCLKVSEDPKMKHEKKSYRGTPDVCLLDTPYKVRPNTERFMKPKPCHG
jgi:hypothetical protein